MRRVWILMAFCTSLAVILGSSALAQADKPATLWGVDEDDHELFSVGDYTKIGGSGNAHIDVYGVLKYLKDGVVTDLPVDRSTGGHIGSIALDPTGVAYMALNLALDVDAGATLQAPVLVSFDTADATASGPNVVTVIGQIPIPGFDEPNGNDNISGLSFDPVTGDLYALWRVNNTPEPDVLLIIDPTSANLLANLGTMAGMSEIVEDGEDLEFDEFGNLFVTDDDDEHLYRVALSPVAIDEVVDSMQFGGFPIGNPKIEGLAWDPGLDQLVGSEDLLELFYIQSQEDGNNTLLGTIPGKTDVEAIDMIIPDIVQADGRLTGGGFQVEITLPDGSEVRVSRGLTIHCDGELSNNLEVNWPFNRWHIEKENIVINCSNDPAITPDPPPAPVDTFEGYAYGSLNGEEGSILCFTFKDAGEPGVNDMASFKIFPPANGNGPGNPCDGDGAVMDTGLLLLSGGNLQAHFDQPHK